MYLIQVLLKEALKMRFLAFCPIRKDNKGPEKSNQRRGGLSKQPGMTPGRVWGSGPPSGSHWGQVCHPEGWAQPGRPGTGGERGH